MTPVLLNIHSIWNWNICQNMANNAGEVMVGDRALNGNVPTRNTIMRLFYINNTTSAKMISCKVEYMILP